MVWHHFFGLPSLATECVRAKKLGEPKLQAVSAGMVRWSSCMVMAMSLVRSSADDESLDRGRSVLWLVLVQMSF